MYNEAVKFLDLLQSLGLVQHVNFPTHISGNTLITRVILFGAIHQDQVAIFQIIVQLYLIYKYIKATVGKKGNIIPENEDY